MVDLMVVLMVVSTFSFFFFFFAFSYFLPFEGFSFIRFYYVGNQGFE